MNYNGISTFDEKIIKYSEKFKNKLIDCHNSRMSTGDIAKIFNISLSTVLYWVKKNFPALKIH